MGDNDQIYEALLVQRLIEDGLEVDTHFFPQLRAHMNRGSSMLCSLARDTSGILALAGRVGGNHEALDSDG